MRDDAHTAAIKWILVAGLGLPLLGAGIYACVYCLHQAYTTIYP